MRILKRHTYFLDVSGTGLEQLPGSLSSSSLCHLRYINLSNNRLSVLPAALAACRGLAVILASGNKITTRGEQRPTWLDLRQITSHSQELKAIPQHKIADNLFNYLA